MMKSKTCKLTEGFRIAFEHRGVQAAEMVSPPAARKSVPTIATKARINGFS